MAQAAALPEVADGHFFTQKIAQHLAHGSAFILVTGCDTASCKMFFDGLSASLLGMGRVIRLYSSDTSTSLFAQLANALGLDHAPVSATSFAKHLGDGNSFFLCSMGEPWTPEAFEQIRQLSNLQPDNRHFGIVMCGDRTLPRQLPVALRQRITAAYQLGGISRTMRGVVWGLVLLALAISVWLAHERYPDFFASTTSIQQPLHSKPLFETSLKAGPVLAQPAPAEAETPLTHVFQTEAEAEAALQEQAPPVEKPGQE